MTIEDARKMLGVIGKTLKKYGSGYVDGSIGTVLGKVRFAKVRLIMPKTSHRYLAKATNGKHSGVWYLHRTFLITFFYLRFTHFFLFFSHVQIGELTFATPCIFSNTLIFSLMPSQLHWCLHKMMRRLCTFYTPLGNPLSFIYSLILAKGAQHVAK